MSRSAVSACPYCGRRGGGYRQQPSGYIAAEEWAEKLMRTHTQHPCPRCGRLTIWKPKRKRVASQ